ncbi:putative tRNA (cytidine(34)-2'-O)-methyltransferase isoform X2 [Trifolium pratense]|uniref:putative tRNA (cytidine(34)-2'-O)-methyltransferase isoform X2 n=1 Tax=Trifolium pratense TaxID=57577 RepID=UPI001E69383B|nr:putative tRNA (cytidine(34)-2'-O)-methyltransferase isoform X2 [Trifolium pratense]
MDIPFPSALKSLNSLASASNPFHFRSKLSLFRHTISLLHFKHPTSPFPSISISSPRFSLLSSLNGSATAAAEISKEGSLPQGVGQGVNESSHSKILQVVLVSPQIPGNTGCIARTCAASAVGLHLVGPLGYKVDDTKLKRAGLDYWPYVIVKIHDSWEGFRDYFLQQEGEKRLLAFTKRGTKIHSDFSYRKGDYLLFGAETTGLPPEALLDCKTEPYGGGTIKIPMVETYVRCLNLSVSVGIALYEASRQLNYESLQIPSETCIDTEEESFITEDIFG